MSEIHDHANQPVHSEAHEGHEGTSYEGTDASVLMVIGSLAVIALTLLVTALITFPIQNMLKKANPIGESPTPLSPSRVIPAEPRLQAHPWEVFPDLVAAQEAQLHSSGKDESGRTYIPIEQAMDAIVPKLNVRANASPGLTVPGGQGRDFAGSIASMPPVYQQSPTIQGEIRKNAQQATH